MGDAGLDAVVSSFLDEHPTPSLTWGVIRDGALAERGATGGATVDTVFRIASMTKSFSAAATLLLRDEGLLRLDDRIADHAPELATLRSDTADAAPITIRDLLSMTSGLPTDDPWADRHLDLTDDEFDEIIAAGPVFADATGSRFEYSNFGFAVLGRVVSRAAGKPIQQVITDRLLEPLGMRATTWERPRHDDWARPMRLVDDEFVDELEPLADGAIAPMGGLWTTVPDLVRWVTWLDDAMPARDGPDDGPLVRASRREMQQPMRYIGRREVRGVSAPASYGFGLLVFDEPDLGAVVTHAGGLPGYGSNMRWLPGRRLGAIALANSTYAPMTTLTALLVDAAVADLDTPPTDASVPDGELVIDAGRRLVALLNDWSNDTARQLVTRSLVEDDALERRRHDAARLVADVGPLTVDRVEPATAARGTVHAVGDTGEPVEITLLLAPRRPPRIQSYTVKRSSTG